MSQGWTVGHRIRRPARQLVRLASHGHPAVDSAGDRRRRALPSSGWWPDARSLGRCGWHERDLLSNIERGRSNPTIGKSAISASRSTSACPSSSRRPSRSRPDLRSSSLATALAGVRHRGTSATFRKGNGPKAAASRPRSRAWPLALRPRRPSSKRSAWTGSTHVTSGSSTAGAVLASTPRRRRRARATARGRGHDLALAPPEYGGGRCDGTSTAAPPRA